MKIVDDTALSKFRGPGRCAVCLKNCHTREPHHIKATGMGSASRLDCAINLVPLGSTRHMLCSCHGFLHEGKITREAVLGLVATREGTTVEAIEIAVHVLLALPPEPKGRDIAGAIACRVAEEWLAAEIRRLVDRTLAERTV